MKWIVSLGVLVLWGVSIVYVYGFGVLAGRFVPNLEMSERAMQRSAPVLMLFMGDYKPCGDVAALDCGFQDVTDRTEVDCSVFHGERTAILMTFGQSNSANAGKDWFFQNDSYLGGGDTPGGAVIPRLQNAAD